MVLSEVSSQLPFKHIAPPRFALFAVNIVLVVVMVLFSLVIIAPPFVFAVFCVNVVLSVVILELMLLSIAPPTFALFILNVVFVVVRVLFSPVSIAPPIVVAVLFVSSVFFICMLLFLAV